MTLRVRLVFWIAMVLMGSLAFGSVVVYWHAVRKVEIETDAAITVGRHTVANVLGELDEVRDPRQLLRALVAGFDGDRHLRASLVTAGDRALAASIPLLSSTSAPPWFFRLLAGRPEAARITLPAPFDQYGTILLETDPRNEINEAWSDTILSLTVLAVFCAVVLVLTYWMLGRALRPLDQMSAAFVRIGEGDYGARFVDRGPQELARLCRGFNQMAARLSEVEMQNDRLERQLAAAQEEERAELARNLHDEIVPLLFAIGVDVAVIRQDQTVRSGGTVAARLETVREALVQIQQHIRVILGRLRPSPAAKLGLAKAIGNLAAFWQKRSAAVCFDVCVTPDSFGERLDEPVYRIVQEAVSNAMRHGRPARIGINVSAREDGAITVEVSDDGGGLNGPGHSLGFGLAGMQERVESLGGTLSVGNGRNGRGVTVSAQFPPELIAQPATRPVQRELLPA